MGGENTEDGVVESNSNHRKLRVLLDQAGREAGRLFAAKLFIGNNDDVRFGRGNVRMDIIFQPNRADQMHIWRRAQDPFHAFAEKVIGTQQQNTLPGHGRACNQTYIMDASIAQKQAQTHRSLAAAGMKKE